MAQPSGPGLFPATDELALAIPRLVNPLDGGGASLPRPLEPSQAAQLRRIFALQGQGDIPAALRAAAALDTTGPVMTGMIGHVLADRYLGPYSKPSADQLRSWMDRYADLPDAAAIRRLLVIRMPAGENLPPVPEGFVAADVPVPEETGPAAAALRRNPDLDRSVIAAARAGGGPQVERLLRATAGLDMPYAAQLRGEAARVLFTRNRTGEAFALAAAGVPNRRGPAPAALAGYMAGLSAWRMERFATARAMFAAAWLSDVSTPALRAASAFWAARADVRTGDGVGAERWLSRAAEQPLTFYGLLARRSLGLGIGPVRVGPSERETLGEADVAAVAEIPAGLRAFALLQIGQTTRAEAESRQLWPLAQEARPLARAAMLVAHAAGMGELAEDYADLLAAADGRPREGLRFRVPRLRPAGGFAVDPALLLGLARTESNFDAALVSPAGARGLLQIMPETARFITGATPEALREALDDPARNLDLGQRYLNYLAEIEPVRGDLIRLLAAYNCGPAALAKLSPGIDDGGDPLMFIESFPIDETRAHVPRVLTYSWIYAARLNIAPPGLDELAAGVWPRYHAWRDPVSAVGFH